MIKFHLGINTFQDWSIILWTAHFFIFPNYLASAQNFGGNSSAIRWRQIDTDTVKVIYPVGIDTEAQRVANLVHYISRTSKQSIGEKQQKIDIVLQNNTVISNGYVGLAPLRSELFLNSPQDAHQLGGNWLDILAIHEYRHVLQLANSRRGLTNLSSYITGQLGWNFMSHLSIPDWFLEGDAVMSETALTAQGRGRIPAFYNDYRSLWQKKILYDYQKARNGSIKDFVPNEYALGFLLTNYGRVNYGSEFWKEVIADAGKYKGLFYPFSSAIKRRTGLTSADLYTNALSYYTETDNIMQKPVKAEIQLNTRDKSDTFTSYEFPMVMDGQLLAVKYSYKKTPGLYQIDGSGEEKLIINQGRTMDYYYSLKNNRIAWAELGSDERWSWQTYSNIIVYNLDKGHRHKLTHSKRYLSPDISYDGQKIIAFEYDPAQHGSLVIISAETGEDISRLENTENYFFAYPRWSKDDLHVVVIARNILGLSAILKINTQTGRSNVLLPFTNHQIGVTYETDTFVYFSASFTGIDNIFRLEKSTGKIYQLTEGALGSYHPAVDSEEKVLYFSRFSSLGSDVYKLSLEQSAPMEINVIEPMEMDAYKFLKLDNEGTDITQHLPDRRFETKKYPQTSGIINFHSWSWLFNDPNVEFALRSDNVLNTFSADIGLRYNTNERNLTYFLEASYSQMYPVFNLAASTSRRSRIEDFPDDPLLGSYELKWWETSFKGGVLFPFDISRGLYKTNLSIIGNFMTTIVDFDEINNSHPTSTYINSLENGIQFLNRRLKAKQNIFAKNSQYLSLNYRYSINDYTAGQLHLDTEWTFPGLALNHNFVVQAAYMEEDAENDYSFSDNFRYSRGYNVPRYDYITKLSANYHAPLFYPDWGFWGIIYFYRSRTNLFFDYSRTYQSLDQTNTTSIQLYNSVGLELVFDTRLLNYYDFSFGLRYAYLLNEDYQNPLRNNIFELFVPLIRF